LRDFEQIFNDPPPTIVRDDVVRSSTQLSLNLI
jgi:hypothetical protein